MFKRCVDDLMRQILPEYYTAEEKLFVALEKIMHLREARLMKRLYHDRWTLRRTGEEFGVTQERVRQIEAKALKIIKSDRAKRILIRELFKTLSSYVDEEIIWLKEKLHNDLTALVDTLFVKNLTVPVSSLEFSVRVSHGLAYAGIKTIGDLVSRKEKEILCIPHIGIKGVREIEDVLRYKNLKLNDIDE